jgi:hypothetical protein
MLYSYDTYSNLTGQISFLASAQWSFQITIYICFHWTLTESIPTMYKMKENKKKMRFIR